MTVDYLDLRAAVAELQDETEDAIRRVPNNGRYILGPEVDAFEREFAAFCGVRHCIGVGNRLDALQLLLRAAGIGPGDEVIVPGYTAVATWRAVTLVGATPIGADVDRNTWNVDAASFAATLSPRNKSVIAVHLFGQPAGMEPLVRLADEHGLMLLEDAAQAHGARYRGRRTGGLALSFYPTKNLGALGDGGAITTDDDELADIARRLRTYGWCERDVSELKGANSRLDELQAAILRVRLRDLERWNRRQVEIAVVYLSALDGHVDAPTVPAWAEPVWHLFAIAVDDRDRFREELARRGIGTLVHYFPLPHLTPAYREDGWREGDLPIAEELARRSVSLPLYPQLGDRSSQQVLEAVLDLCSPSTS